MWMCCAQMWCRNSSSSVRVSFFLLFCFLCVLVFCFFFSSVKVLHWLYNNNNHNNVEQCLHIFTTITKTGVRWMKIISFVFELKLNWLKICHHICFVWWLVFKLSVNFQQASRIGKRHIHWMKYYMLEKKKKKATTTTTKARKIKQCYSRDVQSNVFFFFRLWWIQFMCIINLAIQHTTTVWMCASVCVCVCYSFVQILNTLNCMRRNCRWGKFLRINMDSLLISLASLSAI